MYIGDFKILKEVFNHPDVQGRANPQIHEVDKLVEPFDLLHRISSDPTFKIVTKDPMLQMIAEQRGVSGAGELPGVILSTGQAWTEQKSLTLRALKDVGYGKAGMEEVIAEELVQFTAFLKTFVGKPFEISPKFSLPLINILWRLASSEQFEYDDPQLVKLLEKVTLLFQVQVSPEDKIMLAFPWMGKFAPLRRLLKRDKKLAIMADILSMMEKSILEHEITLDTSMPSHDLIDMVGLARFI